MKDVIEKLKYVYESNKTKQPAGAVEIMEALTKPEKVFLFPVVTATLNKGKELADKIDKALVYWKKQPGAISSAFMMSMMPEDERKHVEDFINNTNKQAWEILRLVSKTLENIKIWLEKPKEEENFFDGWGTKLKEFHQYQGRKYDFGELEAKPLYHNNLKLMKKVMKLILDYDNQTATMDIVRNLFVGILRLMMSNLNLKDD
jgi:hypothetical protein